MKKIIETIKRKWAEYLLEVVVIVGSILGAFALDEWNETLKKEQIEFEILRELKRNLQNDLNNIRENIQRISVTSKGIDLLTGFIENKQVNQDSLEYYITHTFSSTSLGQNTSGYDYIKSEGLTLIKNDSIRRQLSNLHDVSYKLIQRLDEFHWDLLNHKSIPLISNYIKVQEWYLTENAQIVYPEKLRDDIQVWNNLKYIKAVNSSARANYLDAQIHVNQLLKIIESELKRF